MPCKNFHWASFEDCVAAMMREQGYDKETAEKTCGSIKDKVEKGEVTYSPCQMMAEFPTLQKAASGEWFTLDLTWTEENHQRRIQGVASTPTVDRQNESVVKAALEDAMEQFMALPILHYWHTERPVGVIDKAFFEGDKFHIEATIKPTPDCDDVWMAVKKGYLGKFSISGRRKKGSPECKTLPENRVAPCITKAMFLDSISICPTSYAINPDSWLEIKKAMNSNSNLIHPTIDRTEERRREKMVLPNEEEPLTGSQSAPPGTAPVTEGTPSAEEATPPEEQQPDVLTIVQELSERVMRLEQIAGVTKGTTVEKAGKPTLDKQVMDLSGALEELKKSVVRPNPVIVTSELVAGKGAGSNLKLDEIMGGKKK